MTTIGSPEGRMHAPALRILGLWLTLALIVAACGSPSVAGGSAAPPSPSPSPSPSPTPVPTPTPVPAPLTGRLAPPELALRRPIAVMVDDLRPARPQSGFNAASVVWQAPAEGGIPRYMMVFAENDPPSVGPVRSSREYYIGWAAEWTALYVHVGGSPQSLATLRSKGRGQLVWNADQFRWGKYFTRIRERYAPHNVYTDGTRLRKLAAAVGATDYAEPPAPAWTFAPSRPAAERPEGGRIVVPYPQNKIEYAYDRRTNTYLRSVTGEKAQVDAATGERVAPRNVIVMFMRFGRLADGTTKQRLEADFVGSGRALIATNGRMIEGTWEKRSVTAPTRFLDASGEPVTLTVGQTFVQVVTSGTKVTWSNGRVPPPPKPPTAADPV
jgi:hypothetical protein